MIASYGLSHTQLAVRNLDRSIRFYRQTLGMEELHRHGSTAVMMRTPGSHEVFTLNADPELEEIAGKMAGVAHFGFRLKDDPDLETLASELALAGGKILDSGKRGKDKKEKYLFVSDPDGYEVELFWMPVE